MSANLNADRTHVHQLHPAEKPGILVKAGAEPVLKATNIAKWFGENHVLRGASITVWPGETVCILGRSGSGKSTFQNRIERRLAAGDRNKESKG